jgi:ribosomal protein L29
MNVDKLSNDDIKTFDLGKLREAERSVRTEISRSRMDILGSTVQTTVRQRELRRTLARILTATTKSQKN